LKSLHVRAVVAAVLLIAALCAPAVSAGPNCPASVIQLYAGTAASYSIPALDTSYSAPKGVYHASYDLVAGALALDKAVTSGFGYSYVTSGDAYDIAGLPPGTLVPLTAAFDVNGYVQSDDICGGSGCSGFFGARILQGSTTVEQSVSVGFHGRSDLIETLQLPLTATVGTPFQIQFQLYYFVQAGGDGYGGAGQGTFRFAGLPVGATMVSCNGYGSGSVPVRPTTWGKLKTIYR
jgi:hypothetical protein